MNRTITKVGICFALSVLVLAARFLWISKDTAAWVVVEWGYWVMLGSSTWLAISLARAFRGKRLRDIWSRHRVGIVAAVIATVFVQVHEPHRFKVLQDEYVMAGVARSMHYTREAFVGTRAHVLQGTLAVMAHTVEKRPLFFPFLQTCLHDLTGYRPENVFILNAIATFGILLLTYYFGQHYGGHTVGLLCIALWMTLPLFAQESTSAGYDILNLFMLLLFWYCGKEYLDRGGTVAQAAMVLVAAHLAQVRTESILFVVAAAVLVWVRWRKSGALELGWTATVAPLLLFLPLMINLVMTSTPAFLQTDPGQPFISLRYFGEDFGRALLYLFDLNVGRTNSLFLAVIGLVSMVFLAVKSAVRWKTILSDHEWIFIGTMGIIVIGSFVLILCQFWGQLDDPVASRFALPLYLAMICSVGLCLGEILRGRNLPAWVSIVVLCPVAFSASVSTFAMTTNGALWPGREMDWFLKQVMVPEHRGAFLIAPPAGPIDYNLPAIGLEDAEANKWKIKECLKQKLYPEILVLERWTKSMADLKDEPYSKENLYNLKEGAHVKEGCTALSDAFKRQTIAELHLRPNVIARISRIIAVEGKDTDPPKDYQKEGPPFKTLKDYDIHVYEMLP